MFHSRQILRSDAGENLTISRKEAGPERSLPYGWAIRNPGVSGDSGSYPFDNWKQMLACCMLLSVVRNVCNFGHTIVTFFGIGTGSIPRFTRAGRKQPGARGPSHS